MQAFLEELPVDIMLLGVGETADDPGKMIIVAIQFIEQGIKGKVA
jgi:hypothetical protein